MPNTSSRVGGLILLLAGCATTGAESGAVDPMLGTRLPDLSIKGFDGGVVNPRALAGQVVLLDVWASWCAPCKEELPLLDAMAARLRSKGVRILAVSIDEERDAAVEFLKSQPNWSLALAHDPEGRLARVLKPAKMPTSYVVDRAGVVRAVNVGFEREDVSKIEARLLSLANGE